jgi:hypothetical protein
MQNMSTAIPFKAQFDIDFTKADQDALQEVMTELYGARLKFSNMSSAHEGYAVILEELDELWEEVRKRPERRLGRAMRDECRQIAAMAVRMMSDVCGDGE